MSISSRDTNVRESLKRFSNLDPSKGILNLVHPFYKNNPIELRLSWLQWYEEEELTYIDNIPDDPPPAGNLITINIQGVTHDSDNWYFTSYPQDTKRGIVWKIPLNKNLGLTSLDLDNDVTRRDVPQHLFEQSYWHYGDPDYYKGHIFIPLEASKGDMPFGKVVAYRASNMSFVGDADLVEKDDRPPRDDRAPWCAINPRNGLLYTSSFYDDPDEVELHVYRPSITSDNFDLDYVDKFSLHKNDGSAIRLSRIQGGAFSPNGNLYLVSDKTEGGIIVFDTIFGRKFAQIRIEYKPGFVNGIYFGQELEGITIWNLDDIDNGTNIVGQIHLVMLDDDLTKPDQLYFKHFKVSRLELL